MQKNKYQKLSHDPAIEHSELERNIYKSSLVYKRDQTPRWEKTTETELETETECSTAGWSILNWNNRGSSKCMLKSTIWVFVQGRNKE